MAFDKGEFERIVNKRHHSYLDVFFFYITYLGDGWGSVIILFLIFLRKIYYGILALVSFLASTIIVQVMKRLIFADSPRPSKFFEKEIDLHIIQGLELHSFFSFPSGHSSGAFSIFIILAMVSKNQMLVAFYFILSVLVAFSRVYLLQHFFLDTFVGAWIAIIFAFLTYYYIEFKSTLPQKAILHKPLLKAF